MSIGQSALDLSLLERCPHFKRVLCTGFSGIGN